VKGARVASLENGISSTIILGVSELPAFEQICLALPANLRRYKRERGRLVFLCLLFLVCWYPAGAAVMGSYGNWKLHPTYKAPHVYVTGPQRCCRVSAIGNRQNATAVFFLGDHGPGRRAGTRG
jgi:hypothetical protein